MEPYTYPVNDYRSYLRHGDEVERKYGLPDKKKYPMPDRDHVMSAIKFFNYVSPVDEKELAKNIIARIKEYGITDINVGENNRFGKYYKPDYLEHHGIAGMKWGIRNGPPYPLDQSLRTFTDEELKLTNHKNLETWGKSKSTNTLYITGHSGSGKSTIADNIAKRNDVNVIHLDLFMEQHWAPKNSILKDQDIEFTRYLDKHFPNHEDLWNRDKVKPGTREFGKLLENFESSLDGFSEQQFKKNKKVIVEGIQLLDDTLYPDKQYFRDKPTMVMKTKALKSFIRAGIRDEKLNASDLTPADMFEYVRWYSERSVQIRKLLNESINCKI